MSDIVWYYCEYAKNQPRVCAIICAANCKSPKHFGKCKYYEENNPEILEEGEEIVERILFA
jgi:hypothetical protein